MLHELAQDGIETTKLVKVEPLVKVETLVPARVDGGVTWARDSVLFSSCNEDTGSELRAFGSLAGKRVLCITAGGGRVLSLLLTQPDEVWAVDLNPAQNFLLELKVAGMRVLDHPSYLGFLGVRPSRTRLGVYDQLRPMISTNAQQFFDARPRMIQRGVLTGGRLERYLRRVALILRLIQPLGTRRLFSFEDIEEQRRYLARFERGWFRNIAELCCRRWVLKTFSGDPGFYRNVPPEVRLHRAIYDGMLQHFQSHLARDNPVFQFVFFGRWIYEPALPAYLNAKTYERVKAALDNVRLVTLTTTVNHALAEAGPRAFDAFSLSDITSYLDEDANRVLFDEVFDAARPGAKVCARSNLHHRKLPPEHEKRLRRDRALEEQLSIDDHSCMHKFLVGDIL
jgi:S-adenosylmethionine:diacylglycerol 3-amino-3-carboxypropyl transferase